MMFSSVLEIAIGIITSFSGGLGNIPPGWHLCDGTSGTPDLRDKFIVGAGLGYAVDEEGGFVSHSHGFTGDGHSHLPKIGAQISAAPEVPAITDDQSIVGNTDVASSLPPYYALAYIMYLGE